MARQKSVFFGYNVPFYSRNSVLPPQSDERLIKNDILQLLLTSPGERVKRPTFGTPIREFVFQPLDATSEDQIINEVNRAIATFEPRVELRSVVVSTTEDNYLATITVFAAIKNDPNRVLEVEARFVDGTTTRPAQQRNIIANG